MREDLTYSCTHRSAEPETINAKPGQKLRYNGAWFGRFWIGPNASSMAGPMISVKVRLPKGSVLKLGKEEGSCYKPVIYETDNSKGFFVEVTRQGEITEKTISLDEALRTWKIAKVFFVPQQMRDRRATDDPEVYFSMREEERDIESGRVPLYNKGRR